MEDNTTRAIMIGVGLLVILLVIAGVILYVNTARNMASVVNKSLNTWDNITYSNIMEYNGDVTINCTGMDFVNFIRENFMREDIYVTMVAEDTVILDKVNMEYWKNEHSNNANELKLASISVDSNVTMRKKIVTDENGVNTYYITVEFKSNLTASVEAYTNLTDAKNGENAIKAGQKVPLNNGEVTIYYKVMYSKNEAVNSIGGIVYSGGSAVRYTLGEPEIKDSSNSCNIYAIKYGKEVGLINTNYKTYVNAVIAYKKYGQVSVKSVEFEFEFEKDDNVSKPEQPTQEEVVVPADVVIPSGFYYVGGTKDTGLVISDNASDFGKGVDYICVGNQFVWVPVEYYSKFVRGSAQETLTGSGIYKMTGVLKPTYPERQYIEPYEYTREYNAMCISVKNYKGFYIARFEAGDADATAARTTYTQIHKVVSKKGAYVYNYVKWQGSIGAVNLSQNMYKNSNSVVSTLCYGVQWDAIMNFVSDITHNIVDTKLWGNSSILPQKCGNSEAWKAKNIYDLAGNVRELTMETVMCDADGEETYHKVYRNAASRGNIETYTISQQTRFSSSTLFKITK